MTYVLSWRQYQYGPDIATDRGLPSRAPRSLVLETKSVPIQRRFGINSPNYLWVSRAFSFAKREMRQDGHDTTEIQKDMASVWTG